MRDDTPPIRDHKATTLLVRTLDTLTAYRERRARDGDGDIIDAAQAAHDRYVAESEAHSDSPK